MHLDTIRQRYRYTDTQPQDEVNHNDHHQLIIKCYTRITTDR